MKVSAEWIDNSLPSSQRSPICSWGHGCDSCQRSVPSSTLVVGRWNEARLIYRCSEMSAKCFYWHNRHIGKFMCNVCPLNCMMTRDWFNMAELMEMHARWGTNKNKQILLSWASALSWTWANNHTETMNDPHFENSFRLDLWHGFSHLPWQTISIIRA